LISLAETLLKGGFMSEALISSLIVLVIAIVIFLICREIVCWYWKINQMVILFTSMETKISKIMEINGNLMNMLMLKNGFLNENVICPNCQHKVILELSERIDRKFKCPSCNSSVDMGK
jgi:hypothetical protein